MDVLVIGAGLAGCSVGRIMRGSGASVLIAELHDRLSQQAGAPAATGQAPRYRWMYVRDIWGSPSPCAMQRNSQPYRS